MSYTSWINWKISQDSTASQGLDSIFLPVLPIKRKWGWNICRETLLVVVTAITLPATVTIKVYALLYLVAEVEFLQGIEFLTSKTSTSLSVYSPVLSFLFWDLLLTISPTSQLQILNFSSIAWSVNHRLIDWITPKKKSSLQHPHFVFPPEVPRVSVEPRNQTFTTGDEVRIRCSSSGYPPPRLVWTHNDMFIMASSR